MPYGFTPGDRVTWGRRPRVHHGVIVSLPSDEYARVERETRAAPGTAAGTAPTRELVELALLRRLTHG